MSKPIRELLTPSTTAQMLKRSTGSLAKRRLDGGGPAYLKVGGRIFYDPIDVESFLDGCRRRSTSDTAHAA